jgi:hypothetical protein
MASIGRRGRPGAGVAGISVWMDWYMGRVIRSPLQLLLYGKRCRFLAGFGQNS